MQTIIWDWNGTLLNDVEFCVSAINSLLKKRNLALLTTETYKEVFTFPVQNYYKAIGFNFEKEEFAIPAKEFIHIYNKGVDICTLHKLAGKTLLQFKEKNVRQFVLSAMEQNMLERTLKQNSVFGFFEEAFGLNNHHAESKIERGKQLLLTHSIKKEETWMIGDTIHDYEVAKALEINCILVAHGHQSEKRLKNTGAVVVPDLSMIKEVIGVS